MSQGVTGSGFWSGHYGATLHWGSARDGFDSVLSAHNYYGFAFPDKKTSDTDAELVVRLFDENGKEAEDYRAECKTGESHHFSIAKHRPGFEGLVAARLVPRGLLPRRSTPPDKTSRPIATSFFMLYRRGESFADMSHELFLIDGKDPQKATKKAEWLTVVYPAPGVSAGVIVMNNSSRPEVSSGSVGTLQLMRMDSTPLSSAYEFRIPTLGSKKFLLREVFPELMRELNEPVITCIRANQIEQPLSLHLLDSGDFNIHHF